VRKPFSIFCFLRQEDGTVAILWAMGLVVFFGLVAVSFDIGRIGTTQSELQSYADNVALAAAGELDGKNDAITRATGAANALISDTRTFGSGGTVLSGSADYTLTFHSDLPSSDTAALGADVTTDPALAVFARVEAQPSTVSMTFLRVVNSLLGTNTNAVNALVEAEAVAGFTQEACDITPLMFCLPSSGFKANNNIGTMIQLRSGGQGAAWGPGDFGFLDPTKSDLGATCKNLSGVNLLACLVGAELGVTQCFTQRGVDTEPGQKVGIEDAIFNVRFDIYKSIMNGEKNDPDYPPAPNVISGLVPQGGSCIGQNENPSPDTIAIPRDTCFASGTCPYARVGDSVWDQQSYLDVNHDLDGDGVGSDSHLPQLPVGSRFAGSGTRYELYLREIAYGNSGALPGGDILSGLSETGRPQCSSNMSSRPERRVIIAAGIDCAALAAAGNPINGKETNVPVEEYFELFLTEPVGDDGASPPTLDLWVEILGSAGGDGYGSAGTGGIFRDVVQLYR
jgi:Flp pilus assembly protein TadG